MKDTFKKIFAILKTKFGYTYHNLVCYAKTSKNYTPKDGKYAIVNIDNQLKNDDTSRYFYMICMYLDYSGFKVIVKVYGNDFRNYDKPGYVSLKPLILKQKYIFVRNCSTPLNTIVLVQPNIADHIIHLSYGYNIIQSGQFDCIAPYPMYALQYKFYLEPAFFQTVKKSVRSMRIFFAGDVDQRKYHSIRVKQFFNVISRREVIEFISSHFDKTIVLKNDSDRPILNQLMNSEDYINDIIISKLKTKEQDWLKILSKTDFFICPPGVRMPLSHNCIEAMSAGAIPILEYADIFHPHLEDEKNCLSYKSFAELKSAIEKALAMEPSEIEQMRNNVLDYYRDHLSVDSITKKLKAFSNSSQLELNVGIPFIPTTEEWFTLKALYGLPLSPESSDARI